MTLCARGCIETFLRWQESTSSQRPEMSMEILSHGIIAFCDKMAARCELHRLDGKVVLLAEYIDLLPDPRTTNMILNLEDLTGLRLE